MIYLLYGAYQNLRDAAWRCLSDYKISSLPVDILSVIRQAGIKVIKNSVVHKLQLSESGLSLFDGEHWYIIYDDENTVERSRFTLAHEFGHIVLGHDVRKGFHTRFSKFTIKPQIESEADMFASRVLCPSCILWALDLHTATEIAKICRVSLAAAQVRAERMKILYARNQFLKSPLEQQVYRNFSDYLSNHRKE